MLLNILLKTILLCCEVPSKCKNTVSRTQNKKNPQGPSLSYFILPQLKTYHKKRSLLLKSSHAVRSLFSSTHIHSGRSVHLSHTAVNTHEDRVLDTHILVDHVPLDMSNRKHRCPKHKDQVLVQQSYLQKKSL